MSIGEVGDNIRNAAEGLPFDQIDLAYDNVGEAYNTAWEVFKGYTAEEARSALDNFGKAFDLLIEVQAILPEIAHKMHVIANRLGTVARFITVYPA